MTPIKRTRLKFFIVMVVIVAAIVVAFCASILISTYSRNNVNTNLILKDMIKGFDRPVPQGGNISSPDNRFNNFRGFTVKLDSAFEILETNHNGMVFSEAEIAQYVAEIERLKKSKRQAR